MFGLGVMPKRFGNIRNNVLFVILPWKRVYTLSDLKSTTSVQELRAKLEVISGVSSKGCVLQYLNGTDMETKATVTFGVDIYSGMMLRLKILDVYQNVYDICNNGSNDFHYFISENGHDFQFEALFHMCSRGRLEECKKLLSIGIDFRQTTPFGRTCLHAASTGDNFSIIKMLLEAGHNPLLEDHYGYTSADIASYMAPSACVRLLKHAERKWKSNDAKICLQNSGRGFIRLHIPAHLPMPDGKSSDIDNSNSSDKPNEVDGELLAHNKNLYPSASLEEAPGHISRPSTLPEEGNIPSTSCRLLQTDTSMQMVVKGLLGKFWSKQTWKCRDIAERIRPSESAFRVTTSTRRRVHHASKRETDTIPARPLTVPISRLVQRHLDKASRGKKIDHAKIAMNEAVFQDWLSRKREQYTAEKKECESSSDSDSAHDPDDRDSAFSHWLNNKRHLRAKKKQQLHAAEANFHAERIQNFIQISNTDSIYASPADPNTYHRAYKLWVSQNRRASRFVSESCRPPDQEAEISRMNETLYAVKQHTNHGKTDKNRGKHVSFADPQWFGVSSEGSKFPFSPPILASSDEVNFKARDDHGSRGVTVMEKFPMYCKNNTITNYEPLTYEEWLGTKEKLLKKGFSNDKNGASI